MLLVLSPAKKLDFSPSPGVGAPTQPEFLADAQVLIERLRAFSPPEIARLMGLSDRLAVLNATRFAEWCQPFVPGTAKPAALAFDGDVYAGLAAQILDAADWTFAQAHVRILSGLYGVLRPLDLILPYRLEMGTRLENPRGRDLYAFWGERIAQALARAIRAAKAGALINLASEEYFKSVAVASLSVPVIQPVFEDWSGGKYKIVSFYAKRARGLMARFVIRGRLTEPEALQDFDEEGYAFSAEASGASRWVFRRQRSV